MSKSFNHAKKIACNPTPQPWTVQHDVAARPSIVAPCADKQGTLVAHVFSFDRDASIHNIAQASSNARFIVTACNAHNDLLEALEELLLLTLPDTFGGSLQDAQDRARFVIALAKGGG